MRCNELPHGGGLALKPRILVIDDDINITGMLRRVLAFEGYDVTTSESGDEALAILKAQQFDLVILDIMLPGADGFAVCTRIRGVSDIPILMLTARDAVKDRVKGLKAGADDYLPKPFAVEELLARVEALLRRRVDVMPPELTFADAKLNLQSRTLQRGGRTEPLSTTEFDLLQYFMRHPHQVLTRAQIMEAVWGYDFTGSSNVLDVYVGYLRNKLEAGGEPRLIHTVRGTGYVLRE